MRKLGVALVVALTWSSTSWAGDAPVGMSGYSGRIGLMTRSRNLALSDGAHVTGGKWFVIDANIYYSILDSLRDLPTGG